MKNYSHDEDRYEEITKEWKKEWKKMKKEELIKELVLAHWNLKGYREDAYRREYDEDCK